MTLIIGINAFHPDSSACLLIDGELVSAVAEERLGDRNKHTDDFPLNSISWILAENRLKLSDIDYIAIARDPNANKLQKFLYLLKNPSLAYESIKKYKAKNLISDQKIDQLLTLVANGVAPKFEVVNVEHHLAHIASSYYNSNFENDTLGFSFDGAGDFASVMVARCDGTRITPIKRSYTPASFGHFYSAMCQFIGFDGYGEEYKVMGLAPYGEDCFNQEMKELIFPSRRNIIELNSKYISPSQHEKAEYRDGENALRRNYLFTPELEVLLNTEQRKRTDEISQVHMDLAKSTQVRFEDVAIDTLNKYQKLTGFKNLVSAGGCALNGVNNARILRDTKFEKNFIHPAASDDGLAVGAAFYCWHNTLNEKKRFTLKHAYLGPEYSKEQILLAITSAGMKYEDLREDAVVIDRTAQLLNEGKVIGWYQGRSEWGPRALGNRSILANPLVVNMKEIINLKVKKRESFRPFAPSVLQEDVKVYFEQDIDSPFMMHVVKFKEKYRERFPAVTHVDGTGRLQSVSKELNEKYYNLIQKFKEITGYGILLNTSFNENEPVVDTPEQAINCFNRTDIDFLVLGNIMVWK